jgi:hypothetical protein
VAGIYINKYRYRYFIMEVVSSELIKIKAMVSKGKGKGKEGGRAISDPSALAVLKGRALSKCRYRVFTSNMILGIGPRLRQY